MKVLQPRVRFMPLFLISITILVILAEKFLHKTGNAAPVKSFEILFYTHSGEKIAGNTGPGSLKLVTAPFTVYKNLPHQKTETFTINLFGFRGSEISRVCKKQKRIIIVGGSCAFGTGVYSDGDTFQVLLEKLNTGLEVINAGVAGFLSGQELTYVVTELVDFHPDVIMAFNGWNDLFFSWYHYIWFGRQREKSELGYNSNVFSTQIEAKLVANYLTQEKLFNSFQRFFNVVVDKSAILTLLREKVVGFKQRISPHGLSERKETVPGQRGNDYLEDILDAYTTNLKKMQDFCSSQGITFLVVFQPEVGLKSNINSEERTFLANWSNFAPRYESEFPDLYKLFIEKSKKILAENNVNFIDINTCPAFTNNAQTLFCDVAHTNKQGNEVIAQILNESLSSALAIN